MPYPIVVDVEMGEERLVEQSAEALDVAVVALSRSSMPVSWLVMCCGSVAMRSSGIAPL
jgi:hypothetical protein